LLCDPTTHFVRRLRAREPAAWFELWENFGPLLRAQLARWGRGAIGAETVKDLSQETLAALTDAIDRHDPAKGARFSTWLLAIAHHSFCGEMDRRLAQKRGAGRRGSSLDEAFDGASPEPTPDARYEQAVFDAKVAAALRAVEREGGFADFAIFRARVLEGRSGRSVAEALALSEATVSRRVAGVRERLRLRLAETFAKYSFSVEEHAELARNGLASNPNKEGDAAFDGAVAEVVHRLQLESPAPLPARPARVESEHGLLPGPLGRAVRALFPPPDDPAAR
jgi:RNA polymerase sigma factor (sigma-70 family)